LPVYLSNIDGEEPLLRAGAVAGLRFCRDAPEAKSKYAKAIRTALLKALSDRDTRVRLEAVQALALEEDAQAAAALLAVARGDPTARVRQQAVLCLSDLHTEAAVPYLRELLLVDFRLRPNIAAQLREIGSPQARNILRDGLKSANAQVRAECAKQLWLMKDAAGKQTLVDVLRTGSVDSQADVVRFLQDVAAAPSDSPARAPDSTARTWADWLEKQ
jgi:HEAT repeat protein